MRFLKGVRGRFSEINPCRIFENCLCSDFGSMYFMYRFSKRISRGISKPKGSVGRIIESVLGGFSSGIFVTTKDIF